MPGFLAYIIPVGGGPVDPGWGVTPPGSGGGSPPGYWGGGPHPMPPIHYPGAPGSPPSGAHPSHPIWRPDLGIWGGPFDPPHPDQGLPGPQPPSGAHPSHPIVIVPPPPGSGEGAPGIPVQLPVFPWTPSHPIGPISGTPEHPIALPPTMPPPDSRPVEWKIAWTPATGWIVVGVPSGEHPAPSK